MALTKAECPECGVEVPSVLPDGKSLKEVHRWHEGAAIYELNFSCPNGHWFHGAVGPDGSRREAMLEVLERLDALKAELRQKYGEFDIEKDLDELRNARLDELG